MRLSKWIMSGAIALSGGFFGTAQADEVWETKIGDVFYLDEINDYAVFSYPTGHKGIEGKAYIANLAGNYDQRVGVFQGYWTETANPNAKDCSVAIINENGEATKNWGRLTLVFTETAFPSGWVAMRGECFDEPNDPLIGKPLVGSLNDED